MPAAEATAAPSAEDAIEEELLGSVELPDMLLRGWVVLQNRRLLAMSLNHPRLRAINDLTSDEAASVRARVHFLCWRFPQEVAGEAGEELLAEGANQRRAPQWQCGPSVESMTATLVMSATWH